MRDTSRMTLQQKIALQRAAGVHLLIARGQGKAAALGGVSIEDNPYSTMGGPEQHRLAVAWYQEWIKFNREVEHMADYKERWQACFEQAQDEQPEADFDTVSKLADNRLADAEARLIELVRESRPVL